MCLCNLYSILAFHGDLGAVCATLLEAIPYIARVSHVSLSSHLTECCQLVFVLY